MLGLNLEKHLEELNAVSAQVSRCYLPRAYMTVISPSVYITFVSP